VVGIVCARKANTELRASKKMRVFTV